MKIMIVGGTGFLGYYSALVALERGYTVGALAYNDIDLSGWYPADIDVRFGDVFAMTEQELIPYFTGYDAMIYAVGPDDRVCPPAPAYDFFYERLVGHAAKVFRAARKAGVGRSVVLNSYFATFDRMYPQKQLAQHHPYVRCRVQQAEKLIAEGQGQMDVMVLELPYIFGCMPQRIPLWKDVFLERFCKGPVIFFPKGGTSMIAVQHVGEAAVGALEHGKHAVRYPIGDENHTYKQMLDWMTEALGHKKPVVGVPAGVCAWGAGFIARKEAKEGKQAGLDYTHLMTDIMADNMYLDADAVAKELGYGRGGVREAIVQTMHACYPERFA